MIFALCAAAGAVLEACVAPAKVPSKAPSDYRLQFVHVFVQSGTRSPRAAFLPVAHRGNWLCDSEDAFSGRIHENSRRIRRRLDVGSVEFPVSCSIGELTVDGMSQIEKLGGLFRQYLVNGFLASDYINPDELYVRAASHDRNYRTAVSFLRGLYPPAMPDEEVNMIVGSETRDVLRPDPEVCGELADMKRKFIEGDFKQDIERMERVLSEVLKSMEVTSLDYSTMMNLCDFIIQMDCKEHMIPNLTKEGIDECKRMTAKLLYGVYGQNDALKGVAISYGMREMNRVLDDAVSGATRTKMSVFAVDEEEIVALLTMFGKSIETVPPAASNIALEVFMRNSDHYVRITYNGDPMTISSLTESDGMYKLHDFRARFGPLIDHCPEMP